MCKVFFKELRFSSKDKYEIINIEKDIERVVKESGIKDGIMLLFLPHATFTFYFNENEEGLKKDTINFVKDMFEGRSYYHNLIDNNAHAHLANLFLKPFLVLPIVDGRIYKGTWQSINLYELDGPRGLRKVGVMIIGK